MCIGCRVFLSAMCIEVLGCWVQAVFLGLEILVPLMGTEQLKFPKLARAYFTLLSYMLEVYPERVAGLPGAFPAVFPTVSNVNNAPDRSWWSVVCRESQRCLQSSI